VEEVRIRKEIYCGRKEKGFKGKKREIELRKIKIV
jgi:hypothetical protein